jgi:hypothetical protein
MFRLVLGRRSRTSFRVTPFGVAKAGGVALLGVCIWIMAVMATAMAEELVNRRLGYRPGGF